MDGRPFAERLQELAAGARAIIAWGRPFMFYGQHIHHKCYRRPYCDVGQFGALLAAVLDPCLPFVLTAPSLTAAPGS